MYERHHSMHCSTNCIYKAGKHACLGQETHIFTPHSKGNCDSFICPDLELFLDEMIDRISREEEEKRKKRFIAHSITLGTQSTNVGEKRLIKLKLHAGGKENVKINLGIDKDGYTYLPDQRSFGRPDNIYIRNRRLESHYMPFITLAFQSLQS